MIRIEFSVPGLLRDCTGGRQRFTLDVDAGVTFAAAVERLLAAHPLLRRHLFTDAGAPRRHVLIFHNDENASPLDDWASRTVSPGDRISIVQAVSGG
jgi:sulfur carrier protein ThiS